MEKLYGIRSAHCHEYDNVLFSEKEFAMEEIHAHCRKIFGTEFKLLPEVEYNFMFRDIMEYSEVNDVLFIKSKIEERIADGEDLTFEDVRMNYEYYSYYSRFHIEELTVVK